jgi:hypothetical protein
VRGGSGFDYECTGEKRVLTLTGPWTGQAESLLATGQVDHLNLNYTAGFCEPDLGFIGRWPLARVTMLDRRVRDVRGIERLGDALRELYVQADPRARLDLSSLPQIVSLAADWKLVAHSIGALRDLRELSTWNYAPADLHELSAHSGLERLAIADARRLDSLEGIECLQSLWRLEVALAPSLCDISAISVLGDALREVTFETCRRIAGVGPVATLTRLRGFGIANCGDIASIGPLASMSELRWLLAWESTRIVDGDLSVLETLPSLEEVRMRGRREYTPSLEAIRALIASRAS